MGIWKAWYLFSELIGSPKMWLCLPFQWYIIWYERTWEGAIKHSGDMTLFDSVMSAKLKYCFYSFLYWPFTMWSSAIIIFFGASIKVLQYQWKCHFELCWFNIWHQWPLTKWCLITNTWQMCMEGPVTFHVSDVNIDVNILK